MWVEQGLVASIRRGSDRPPPNFDFPPPPRQPRHVDRLLHHLRLSFFNQNADKNRNYLLRYVGGTKNVWQVFLVGGMALGSLLSNSLSGVQPILSNASPLQCFIGGIFLLMGSRIADGCTSGHGISGMANL